MIIDSSALLAMILKEDDGEHFKHAIMAANIRLLSAANYVEIGLRLTYGNDDPLPARKIDGLIEVMKIAIEPVTAEQAKIALSAFRDFGRSKHPAALNYGDCFAYALAQDKRMPLLFKGNDFSQTDVRSAMARH
jgi:ribonuclease VapC